MTHNTRGPTPKPATDHRPLTTDFDRFARFYDADMGDFVDDLPFYRELARRADGPILDAMCGTGRIVVPLAQAGFSCVGLDISPAMVAVVERKIDSYGLEQRLRVTHGDIRAFDLPDRFGLILVPLNSLMHLESTTDQLAALESLRRHLRPDGALVIDLFNPDPRDLLTDQGVLVHERTFSFEGRQVQKYVLRRTDAARQCQHVEFMYDEMDSEGCVRRYVLPFVMRWLYRFEAEHLLARAGLSIEAIYGDYDLEPYGSDSPQLIIVARIGE